MVLLATRIAQCHLNQFEDERTYNFDCDNDKDDEDSNSTLTNAENGPLLRLLKFFEILKATNSIKYIL